MEISLAEEAEKRLLAGKLSSVVEEVVILNLHQMTARVGEVPLHQMQTHRKLFSSEAADLLVW